MSSPRRDVGGKDGGKKKTEEEKPGRAVSKSLSGPFSRCDVILIKPYSTNSHFLIHTCTKVQKGVELTLKEKKIRTRHLNVFNEASQRADN